MAVRVVLLNGPGSVGKTSVARALQEICAQPFLHVAMDSFLEMLPLALQDGGEGLRYEVDRGAGALMVNVKRGPVADRLIAGMHLAALGLAQAGNALILDDVLLQGAPEAYGALQPFGLFRVGLTAPLAVLEAREKARGDRMIGLARAQHIAVHQGIRYDLQIDTAVHDAATAARMIADSAGLALASGRA